MYLPAGMRFMWPAIEQVSCLGYFNLFDDYPDRIDATYKLSFRMQSYDILFYLPNNSSIFRSHQMAYVME